MLLRVVHTSGRRARVLRGVRTARNGLPRRCALKNVRVPFAAARGAMRLAIKQFAWRVDADSGADRAAKAGIRVGACLVSRALLLCIVIRARFRAALARMPFVHALIGVHPARIRIAVVVGALDGHEDGRCRRCRGGDGAASVGGDLARGVRRSARVDKAGGGAIFRGQPRAERAVAGRGDGVVVARLRIFIDAILQGCVLRTGVEGRADGCVAGERAAGRVLRRRRFARVDVGVVCALRHAGILRRVVVA